MIVPAAFGFLGKVKTIRFDNIAQINIEEVSAPKSNPLSSLLPVLYKNILIIGRSPDSKVTTLRGNHFTKKDFTALVEQLSKYTKQ